MSGTFEQPIPWSTQRTTYPRMPCALFSSSARISSSDQSVDGATGMWIRSSIVARRPAAAISA